MGNQSRLALPLAVALSRSGRSLRDGVAAVVKRGLQDLTIADSLEIDCGTLIISNVFAKLYAKGSFGLMVFASMVLKPASEQGAERAARHGAVASSQKSESGQRLIKLLPNF